MVYNAELPILEKKLWKELSLIPKLNLPWIVLGDFNAIMSTAEHKESNFRYYARKAYLFSKFIFDNVLIDVSYLGASFSWCNGQRGLARRWARLDRCLVNDI